MVPKRVEQLLDGGSIYWVIRGQIACRERILAVRPFVDKEGSAVATLSSIRNASWWNRARSARSRDGGTSRPKDAPRDLERAAPGASAMPEPLRRNCASSA
jgi:hypothetical protein